MKNYCINRAFQLSVFYTSCFSLKKKSKKKSRTHGETRHSRDRQGRVSVRRLGLVYTCDGNFLRCTFFLGLLGCGLCKTSRPDKKDELLKRTAKKKG